MEGGSCRVLRRKRGRKVECGGKGGGRELEEESESSGVEEEPGTYLMQ